MIKQKLLQIIETNKNTGNALFVRTLLKEALQNYILNFVYDDLTYKKLIFTGGTCLRKIYGLPRLSEDLDFDFLETFNNKMFAQQVKDYFNKELQYKDLETKISLNNNIIFFKFPLLSEIGFSSNLSQEVLFVRCDFSKEAMGIFKTEVNSISTNEFSFFALSYDLSTLFANKIIAFLSREFFKGASQTIPFKGRDIFDLIWFIEQSAKKGFSLQPYWQRIFKGLNLKSKDEVIEALQNKIKKIDKKSVYSDLLPFISSYDTLQNFTDNFVKIFEDKFNYFR
ncbi:MAG: hypothetical protein ACD_12C00042G0002 [uncultured bacterium]|nr:MAG: hypothetical protein ACD_12C00042G0002 [uncultured bacterium]